MQPRPPSSSGKQRQGEGGGGGGESGGQATMESLRRRIKYAEQQHRDVQDPTLKELQRQRRELDSLKRDNELLKQQLNEVRASEVTAATVSSTGGGGGMRVKSARGSRKSKELDAKRDTLQHLELRLQDAQQGNYDLQQQHDSNRALIKERRREMGGVNATKENHEAIQKQVAVLENRLDQSLVKFNDVLKQNKQLRDQIDTLRGERDVFEAIYQKLENELQERKKEMAFIIEVSNIAYEERDNNAQVLQSLKAFAAEEMNTFAGTFKELDELMESDRRTKENVKGRIAALEKREQQRSADDKARTISKATEKAENAPDVGAVESQTLIYEDVFARLRQATDISELSQLVQRFLTAEEDNFSLYAYVNDLGKSIEDLEKQRANTIGHIDAVALGTDGDKARRTTLRDLEDKLRAEEKANQQFVDLTNRTNNVLHGIMTTVEGLFERLDCDTAEIVAKHGVTGLSLDSLLLHLAAVEKRAEQHMSEWFHQNGLFSDGTGGTRGPLVPMGAAQIVVADHKMPNTGEDADFSDHDDFPLSREDMLRVVQKRMVSSTAEKRTVRAGAKRGVVVKK